MGCKTLPLPAHRQDDVWKAHRSEPRSIALELNTGLLQCQWNCTGFVLITIDYLWGSQRAWRGMGGLWMQDLARRPSQSSSLRPAWRSPPSAEQEGHLLAAPSWWHIPMAPYSHPWAAPASHHGGEPSTVQGVAWEEQAAEPALAQQMQCRDYRSPPWKQDGLHVEMGANVAVLILCLLLALYSETENTVGWVKSSECIPSHIISTVKLSRWPRDCSWKSQLFSPPEIYAFFQSEICVFSVHTCSHHLTSGSGSSR